MKKVFFTVLLFSSLVGLAGCGAQDTAKTETTTTSTASTQTSEEKMTYQELSDSYVEKAVGLNQSYQVYLNDPSQENLDKLVQLAQINRLIAESDHEKTQKYDKAQLKVIAAMEKYATAVEDISKNLDSADKIDAAYAKFNQVVESGKTTETTTSTTLSSSTSTK
ncbi:MAG: hypothetical protein ACK5NA_03810 [Enterococcus sp.]